MGKGWVEGEVGGLRDRKEGGRGGRGGRGGLVGKG